MRIPKRHILALLFCLVSMLLSAETLVCTVDSYRAVQLSGDVPDGAEAAFLSTTQSGGRITAGNTATLTLSGMEGVTVRSLALYMRSNKSAGAGSFRMYTDAQVVATISDAPFSASSWNGAYCSESLVRIEVPMAAFRLHGTLTMEITASANSLYIGSYEITYTPPSPSLGVVSFVTGTSQYIPDKSEFYRGGGVILPALQSPDADWSFLGWTTASVSQTTQCPEYFPAGSHFYPKGRTMLYALYRNGETPADFLNTDSLSSGVYALANYDYSCLMTGPVINRHVGARNVEIEAVMDVSFYSIPGDAVTEDCRYVLTCTSEGVTVQHEQSGRYIGYTSGASPSLRAEENVWTVYPGIDGSVMLCHGLNADGLAYCLQPTLLQSDTTCFADIRLQLQSNGMYLLLFPLPTVMPSPPLYSTSILTELHLETRANPLRITSDRIFNPMGLTISLYDIAGNLLIQSRTDISLGQYPRGCYLLLADGIPYKIYR